MDSLAEVFGDVISSYSRKQAIEDGVLVDLSAMAPGLCLEHYKHPIACTSSVFAIVQKAGREGVLYGLQGT